MFSWLNPARSGHFNVPREKWKPEFRSVQSHGEYLGCVQAKGLWGVKQTRQPIDQLVLKSMKENSSVPCTIKIDRTGMRFDTWLGNGTVFLPKENIAFAVQDMIHPTTAAVMVLKDNTTLDKSPYECYVFRFETKAMACQLVKALAAVFKLYKEELVATCLEEEGRLGMTLAPTTPMASKKLVDSDA